MPEKPPPVPIPTEPHVTKEPTLTKAPPAGKLFPCANCGAKVEFDPHSRSLKCPYCGHETAISAPGKGEKAKVVVEHDFEAYVRKLEEVSTGSISGHSSQVRCTGCGAVVLLEDKVVTENCPFCGTHLENKPESVEGMIPPESMIPFKLDLHAARQAFRKWIEDLWFAPFALKKLAVLGQLNGIYIPYWTYDAMTYTHYDGLRGDDYQETEYYTEQDAQGNSVTKSRTVTKTRWTPVSGQVQHFFDDVLVCGSKSLASHLVDSLEPWKLMELEPFKSEFLAGLKTERYALGLRDGLVVAKRKMEPTIDSLIRQDIGGNHQQISMKHTRYLAITFKHCLLPVWVANYRYQDKLFHILINGRTGKVSGERPWSFWKIFGLVAAILAVIAVIAMIVMSAQKSSSPQQPDFGPQPGIQRKVGQIPQLKLPVENKIAQSKRPASEARVDPKPFENLAAERAVESLRLPSELANFYAKNEGVGLSSSPDRIVRLCRLDEVARIGWRDLHIFGANKLPAGWEAFAAYRIGVSSFFDEIVYVLDAPICPAGSILTIGVDVAGPGGSGPASLESSLVLASSFAKWLKHLEQTDWVEYGLSPGGLAELRKDEQKKHRHYYHILNPGISWGVAEP